MFDWILTAVRWLGSLGSKAKRRVKKWAADRQRLVDETADVVTDVKEFIRSASPMAATIEDVPGAIAARLEALGTEWSRLRPKLVKRTDRHPSDEVQRLGNELAEDVELLLMALRYMGNPLTDPQEKAAASESAFERHEHAKTLSADLLERVRAY